MSKDDTRQTKSFFTITQEEITSIGFEDRIFSVIDEKKKEKLTNYYHDRANR